MLTISDTVSFCTEDLITMTVSPDLLGLARQITQNYNNAQIAQLVRLISPVSPNALMGSDEFERVMAILLGKSRHRPFSARSIAAARLVLVMGASVQKPPWKRAWPGRSCTSLCCAFDHGWRVCQVIGSRLRLGFLLQLQARWSS